VNVDEKVDSAKRSGTIALCLAASLSVIPLVPKLVQIVTGRNVRLVIAAVT